MQFFLEPSFLKKHYFIKLTGVTPGNFDLVIVNEKVDEAYKCLREFLLGDIEQLNTTLTGDKGGAGDQP